MVLDSEQQQKLILGIIDTTNVNAQFKDILQIATVLHQLRTEVEKAKIGDHSGCTCSSTVGCNSTEGQPN